jgi:hypothetical protein
MQAVFTCSIQNTKKKIRNPHTRMEDTLVNGQNIGCTRHQLGGGIEGIDEVETRGHLEGCFH